MVLALGSMLENRYHIKALLGQGGMGAVYCAYDDRLHKLVAAKGVSREVIEGTRKQFEREPLMLMRQSFRGEQNDELPYGRD